MSADYGCRRLFFMGKLGWWGGKMGLWIFLSWNCIFDWKYISKSVNFTFSLPFLKVKTVVKWSFSRKYDALPSNFRVESVRSRYNLTRWGISPHSIFRNGVNGSLWPSRLALERDEILPSTRNSHVSFRGNNIRLPLASISGLPRWRGLKRGK